MRTVLSGNEAIARGAFEAGVLFASAYPGTVRHPLVEQRIVELSGYGDTAAINRTELRSMKIGIICASVVPIKALAVNRTAFAMGRAL